MKISAFIFGFALSLILLSGCASSSSYVLVGTKRPPIDPAKVMLYLHPPAKYEEVALLSANSRYVFVGASDQHKMDVAIGHLKSEAAALGANGILLSDVGDQCAGSVGLGSGTATAYGSGSSATSFGAGSSFGAPIMIKAASGTAIYVTQE
jgi:hypothetical protein